MQFKSLYHELQKIIPVNIQEFEIFSRDLKIIQLKKNEIWEHADKVSQLMGFVHSGLLRQYTIKDGIEFTTDFFVENDFTGNYVSFQTQTPSTTITEALEPSELYVISFAKFESYYQSIPATEKTAQIVAKSKLLKIHERNTDLLMNSPEERYDQLLQQRPSLLNRVPQYIIAQYLGIRPESLSRIRKRYKS